MADTPEFVRMEADMRFAGRHGTEQGDDPVFDELSRYAADLRECLRTIINCDLYSTGRYAVNPTCYERMLSRYKDALRKGRKLLRRKNGDGMQKPVKARKTSKERHRIRAYPGDLAEIWGAD